MWAGGLFRLGAAAALCFALTAPTLADKFHKIGTKTTLSASKKVVKKTVLHQISAVKRTPQQETVSGLTRRIAQLKREATQKRLAQKGKEQDAANGAEARADEDEAAGTDYLEAHLFYLRQRAYPKDIADWSAYPRARKHAATMPTARMGGGLVHSNISSGSWRFVGPNGLAVPYRTYYGVNTLNGRTNALAFDPVTAGTYYMATAGGGLWRTTDSGKTWNPLSDTWPTLQTSSVAIDPTNHNIIYVGTGDFDGGGFLSNGIMKTTDGGATWTNTGNMEFGSCAVSAIAIDPENPQLITVAAGRGASAVTSLWNSTDGGATWSDALDAPVAWSSLSYGPKSRSGARHLYAAGVGDGFSYGNGDQVYVSDDNGATWGALSTQPAMFQDPTSQICLRVVASATDLNKFYLLDGFNRKIWSGLITLTGITWTDVTGNFLNGQTNNGVTDNYNWSQQSYDFHIECGSRVAGGKPTDVLYVGLIDLEQSLDGGATWQSLGGPTFTGNSILHNDQHCLALNPNGSGEALVGCDGGVFRLTDNTSTNAYTYTGLNPIGGATQFYHIAPHPNSPNYFLGGAQDNATPALVGNTAKWKNVAGGDGGFCAIRDTNNQFATSQELTIYQTKNGWTSSTNITPNAAGDLVGFIAPIVLDPTGTYLYAGTNYLYRYKLTTSLWDNRLGGVVLGDPAGDFIVTIAIAPSDANQLYTASVTGQIWWSPDAGQTWKQINAAPTALPQLSPSSLVVSPTNSHSVLVGFSGSGAPHLWLCSDVTATHPVWTNVSGAGATGLPDISLNAIALDVYAQDTTWYVGTDIGVFTTVDSGAHWANMTQALGLPNVQVNDLKAIAGTNTLYAGTYGRGIWAINLTRPTFRAIAGNIHLDGVPNPTAVYSAAAIGPVTIEFRSRTGAPTLFRTVTLPADGFFSFSDVPADNYTVAVKASKWLRATAPADLTSSDVTNLNFLLVAGDANNDNSVDTLDFGILVGAYNSDARINGTGYDVKADFNCDGYVDTSDFSLLVGGYNQVGAN